MEHARIERIRELAKAFVDGTDQTRDATNELEGLLDEEFPEDEEMQDHMSDLARFTPGGGEHLLNEGDVVQLCKSILLGLERSDTNKSA